MDCDVETAVGTEVSGGNPGGTDTCCPLLFCNLPSLTEHDMNDEMNYEQDLDTIQRCLNKYKTTREWPPIFTKVWFIIKFGQETEIFSYDSSF